VHWDGRGITSLIDHDPLVPACWSAPAGDTAQRRGRRGRSARSCCRGRGAAVIADPGGIDALASEAAEWDARTGRHHLVGRPFERRAGTRARRPSASWSPRRQNRPAPRRPAARHDRRGSRRAVARGRAEAPRRGAPSMPRRSCATSDRRRRRHLEGALQHRVEGPQRAVLARPRPAPDGRSRPQPTKPCGRSRAGHHRRRTSGQVARLLRDR
jgi:hypothetical protein